MRRSLWIRQLFRLRSLSQSICVHKSPISHLTAMSATEATKRPLEDAAAAPEAKKQDSKYTREDFLSVFPKLADLIVNDTLPKYEMPEEARNWVREMIEYTLPGGKLNRGLTVVHTTKLILGDRATPDIIEKAAVLGWCVEWLQAFFLVADDVMDSSVTRRGQPCWYKQPKVGLVAINDSFILEASIRHILKHYFRGTPQYGEFLELFMETTWQTELGQLMDLTAQPQDKPVDLERFTEERHTLIVKYKTAFYSFYLPVALGMVLSGLDSEAALKEAEDILVEMGVYFQVQDDYLDCYGAPEVIGKIGTDIQDTKCSWLVVQAMKVATPEQLATIKAHYGKDNEADIAVIKELYKTLGIEEKYHAYEAKVVEGLKAKIAGASNGVPSAVYDALLSKIYKREK